MKKLLAATAIIGLCLVGIFAFSNHQTVEAGPTNCDRYTYDAGFNHAKSVLTCCCYSQTILDNTYDLNMSNPCWEFRVGFAEGWAAYRNYCRNGGNLPQE